ncbi:dihydropteroate synthase [Geoalkalibacter halelectricus]|uniref:Dihydropteroate synthase n=1 Tax=Geoalkalibacter halelectricus TaxID=2847045 RepID=A0ABY5ZMS0_9BACT|nr:dihydropteroate synthase [Geoalkalibacter halelectricus]MDO3379123.1 dihydropteroate synthase [Geoalkalibacter halelectricus]UWZ79009.1 dihydropteroate synthase [Geoalkalibacter halelectricus]
MHSLTGRSCRLDLRRPCIMGILNVTPDSFSDGGRFLAPRAALEQARLMVAEGADVLDVGGESTRPGSQGVSEEEELARVVPVIELLARELPVPLSIDTTKSRVARAAMVAGAHFINDISGLRFDPGMARVAAETGAGLFLMHTSHRPERMQAHVDYQDLIGEILDYLRQGMEDALAAGVEVDKIAVDPGIGFGKTQEGNLEILRRLPEFLRLGRPVLLGTSRKSFLGAILDQPDPRQRLYPTLATVALGVAAGVRIFRVHDVGPAREVALTAFAVHPYDSSN